MIYTGIGSRETPDFVLNIMKQVGQKLAERNIVLRSGGACGADSAFELGCDLINTKLKEIYIPWKGFSNSLSKYNEVSIDALNLAKEYHPYWNNLKVGAKKLHARNCYQILGYDLKTPTNFVLCYTTLGNRKGGTGQALRIAEDYNIPIFDFGCYTEIEMKEAVSGFINKQLKRK